MKLDKKMLCALCHNPTGFIMKKRTRTIQKQTSVVKVIYSNHYCGEIQAWGNKVSTDTGPVLVKLFIVFENLYLNMTTKGHLCTSRMLTCLRPCALTTINGTYLLFESTIFSLWPQNNVDLFIFLLRIHKGIQSKIYVRNFEINSHKVEEIFKLQYCISVNLKLSVRGD